MTGQLDIRDNLRDDERRRRDEHRLRELEAAFEHLRHSFLDNASKQDRIEELYKNYDVALAQMAARVDAQQHALAQANDARQLDIERLRQEVEELTIRSETGIAPLPELQAQLADLLAHDRALTQEVERYNLRHDALVERVDQLPPRIDRAVESARAVHDEIESVLALLESRATDIQRAIDAVQVLEQESRRRFSDIAESIQTVNARIDVLKDELPVLSVQLDRVRHELRQVIPRFEALEAGDVETREAVDRAVAAGIDHHRQALARIEEFRDAGEARVQGVERLNDTRFSATMSRFGTLEESDRSLAHRLALLMVRMDEARDADRQIRMEVHKLEEVRLRVRFEQAQREIASMSEFLKKLAAAASAPASPEDGESE